MLILAALMDQLGIAKADLIDNSLGGRIAWNFAADYPGRVNRLVLISPDGFASPGFAYGVKPRLPFIMRLLPYTLPRSMLRMNLAVAYADPKKLSDATLAVSGHDAGAGQPPRDSGANPTGDFTAPEATLAKSRCPR